MRGEPERSAAVGRDDVNVSGMHEGDAAGLDVGEAQDARFAIGQRGSTEGKATQRGQNG